MHKSRVQKLYHIAGAKWYDPFKKVWNALVARKAEKALNRFLKENIKPETAILELGPGTALNLQKIKKLNLSFASYEGWDFSDDMLAIAKKKFKEYSNVHFKKQDLTDIPEGHQKFDVILCTWVLSHLHTPSELVNRAQNLLKKDGKMFLVFFGKSEGWFGSLTDLLGRNIFAARYVDDDQIQAFNNVNRLQKSLKGLTTIVEISPSKN